MPSGHNAVFETLSPLAPKPFDDISRNLVQGCSITRSTTIARRSRVQQMVGANSEAAEYKTLDETLIYKKQHVSAKLSSTYRTWPNPNRISFATACGNRPNWSYSDSLHIRSPLPAAFAVCVWFRGIPLSVTLPYATKMSCILYRRARRMPVPSRSESVAKSTNAHTREFIVIWSVLPRAGVFAWVSFMCIFKCFSIYVLFFIIDISIGHIGLTLWHIVWRC